MGTFFFFFFFFFYVSRFLGFSMFAMIEHEILDDTSVVVLNVLCFLSRIVVLFEPYVRFHIFSSVRVTE